MCREARFLVVLTAAVFAGCGQNTPPEDTKIDLEKLGVAPVPPKKDPLTGVVIGGKNPTALIRTLTELNGRKIADLERDMRPGVLSNAGFLGKDERLLDVLAADNAFVVDELGLTHQELARHLRIAGSLAVDHYYQDRRAGEPAYKEFVYHRRRYRVSAKCWMGVQESPSRTTRERTATRPSGI
jgi:hypothetical protein